MSMYFQLIFLLLAKRLRLQLRIGEEEKMWKSSSKERSVYVLVTRFLRLVYIFAFRTVKLDAILVNTIRKAQR